MIKTSRARLQKLVWQWRGVLIAAPSIALSILLLRSLGGLQILELAALDQMFIFRGQASLESQVVIVDITEEDVRKSLRWPLTDEQLLKILQNIKAQKPSAIGLDMYRDLAIEPGHQELIKFMAATPNLFGIKKVLGENIKPPLGLKYPDQVGANDLINDPDTKVRRFYLAIPVLEPGDGKNPPRKSDIDGFGVKLALKYLSDRQINPEVIDPEKLQYRIGNLSFQPFKSNNGGYSRVNDRGYQLILNYRGGRGSFSRITLSEVRENQIPAGFFTGKVVLLGASAESLNDLHNTPFSSSIVGTPQRMPGVEIHAQVVSQLIDGAINHRPLIQGWSESQEIIWIFAWSLVGGTLTWGQRNSQQRGSRAILKVASIPIAALGVIIFSYSCFQGGTWVPLVPALLALAGSSLSITGYIAKTAGEIRATFGRYITDDVVATLLENPNGAKLGGERRLITILTSDLRGFTALAESLSPEEVVKILNIYLGIMAEVISEYQGTIDEFMGDGILVLFGAPMLQEDDPERAVACAIAMQLAMTRVNQEMAKLGRSELSMGIGINTGEVVVGNIGSAKRTKYGVVGSQVNLTYRIESYTTAGQILISTATHQAVTNPVTYFPDQIKANLRIDETKEVIPKGVKEPITIYSIRGIQGKYQLTLPEKIIDSLHNLPVPIALNFAVLDGKDVSSQTIPATLVKLGQRSAEISSPMILADLTNIKINLMLGGEPTLAVEDIYAKVLGHQGQNGNFRITFTALTPKIELSLNELYQSCQLELVNSGNKSE
jgi:adenylate cyclase